MIIFLGMFLASEEFNDGDSRCNCDEESELGVLPRIQIPEVDSLRDAEFGIVGLFL